MIKECNIKLNNEAVTVVDFGGIDIQFPSIGMEAKKVYVKYEDNRYEIVEKPKETQKTVVKENQTTKNDTKKKTTINKGEDILEEEIKTEDNA